MVAVTIHDLRPDVRVLAVDLIDVLRLFEPEASASLWRVKEIECTGGLADEFMSLGDAIATVSGSALIRLATGVQQVIWGDFEAYRPGEERCWLVIRAIDSTLYVVIAENAGLLTRVQSRFSDVRLSPEDAEYIDYSH